MAEHPERGTKKKLTFLPSDYEDMVFVRSTSSVVRAVAALFAPVMRAVLSVRRFLRRAVGIARRPPRDR